MFSLWALFAMTYSENILKHREVALKMFGVVKVLWRSLSVKRVKFTWQWNVTGNIAQTCADTSLLVGCKGERLSRHCWDCKISAFISVNSLHLFKNNSSLLSNKTVAVENNDTEFILCVLLLNLSVCTLTTGLFSGFGRHQNILQKCTVVQESLLQQPDAW